MGKLSEAAIVNSINSEYVLLTDSNGLPVRISKNNLAEVIRGVMNEANITDKGLMPSGMIGSMNKGASTLLCETRSITVTASMLLSISATTTGLPNLYFITMARASGNTGDPIIKVKVLAGSYNMKIIGKTDADGKCKVYAERNQFTPILDVIAMSTYGITMKMETADNSDFEGGFEATLE
jgi:hypothetical protein